MNLADEYVNIINKYGHWKDMGIRIDGQPANTFTQLFFKNWCLLTHDDINIENFYYVPNNKHHLDSNKALVAPFGSAPTNFSNIAEHNYLKIINNAKKYVYIVTPYLIIDGDIITCLNLDAKSGVDVRILVPGVADKNQYMKLQSLILKN